MKSRHLSIALAALIVFIWLINAFANEVHLYFLLWWFDIPMHMLGGFWVALTSMVIYYHLGWVHRHDRSPSFVVTAMLATTLIIGIFWEVFEFSVEHLVKLNDNGVFDTLKDLLDDMIGAVIASVIFIKKGYNKTI